MTYVLDTDAISELMRPSPSLRMLQRVGTTPIAEQATTSITVGELLHGALISSRPEFLRGRILELLRGAPLRVLPFDTNAAMEYAEIRANLQRAGTPIGDADLRIAAIVKSARATLVTGNERHFGRVDGLVVENWIR